MYGLGRQVQIAVKRRIGGLEMTAWLNQRAKKATRRIGGLENHGEAHLRALYQTLHKRFRNTVPGAA